MNLLAILCSMPFLIVGKAQAAPAHNDAPVTGGNQEQGWVISGLTPGEVYDIDFSYTTPTLGDKVPYLSAAGRKATLTDGATTAMTGTLRGVHANPTGKIPVMLNNALSGVTVSDLTATKANAVTDLVMGGDLSLLTHLENNKAAFYDESGKSVDCLDFVADNGMNLARLRLYNDPGNPDYSPSKRLPAGIQSPEDILTLARRAKDKGMQILVTFYYSDYWADGAHQTKPHAWADLSYADLKKAVYDFTKDYMQKLIAQGTTPEFVSIGNEIQAGILFPDGACGNPRQMAELLNAGAKAVRELTPDARIVIHSAAGEGMAESTLKWFFGLLRDYNVDYDIIGISYYPFWSNSSASQFRAVANRLINGFDKDILIMETGYSWNATLPSGYPGQLSHNGPYAEFSKLGQRDFMLDLSNQIKQVNSGRVLGYIYWDPIFIETPGLGWVVGGQNVISNTTLFGFQGESLPVLDAYKYNN